MSHSSSLLPSLATQPRTSTCFAALGLLSLGLLLAQAPARRGAQAQAPPAAPTFRQDVLPVLKAHCLRCHGGTARRGGLDLSSLASLLEGGTGGPAVKAGAPDRSPLWERVKADEMPPGPAKLSQAQKALLRAWIAAGAPDGPGQGGGDVRADGGQDGRARARDRAARPVEENRGNHRQRRRGRRGDRDDRGDRGEDRRR